MSTPFLKLPEIPEEEQTPLVQTLVQMLLHQQVYIEQLEDEIKELKKHKTRPRIGPSKMDEGTEPKDDDERDPDTGSPSSSGKKARPKKKKNANLQVHATEKIAVEAPEGSVFKGYQEYVVQDLRIEPYNTRYLLEQWQTPEGKYLIAKVPASVRGRHFGPTLISYILHQHYHQHVTQPLLLEQLSSLGIAISSGQLSRVLTEGKEAFHEEKDALLSVGTQVSRYLQTDDTGARHIGHNGYCTYIGNELFAWFQSTQSKSRINFLALLRAEHQDYVLNAGALEYMARNKLPQIKLSQLELGRTFVNQEAWEAYLKERGLRGKRHRQIATEGALMGSLLAHGFPSDMGIVSDDAGQFNVFEHALCWIHAERGINSLIPFNESHRKALAWARTQIWDLYADLKGYKHNPQPALKQEIGARFDEVCATRTRFQTLNEALKRLHQNKAELLRVLDKPWLPLHNNLSERDLRDYVKKRKISGGTRSDEGRRCRDTFASLKKTCRKHGISFWDYLKDRVARVNAILPLPHYIRQAAQDHA